MSEGNEVVAKALQRRAELAAEMRRIDDFLRLYAELEGVPYETLLKNATDLARAPSPNYREMLRSVDESIKYKVMSDAGAFSILNSARLDKEVDPSIGMSQPEFTELAKQLLIQAGRPLGSHRLLTRFQEAGRRVGGTDELRNLTTKLWRARSEIIKIPGAGYWPVDVPCPVVSYVPPVNTERNSHERLPGESLTPPMPSRDQQLAEIGNGDDMDDEIPF